MTDCKSVTSLPESFCDLKSLKTLQLRGNYYDMGLVSLPERFGQLKSLVTLNLSMTAIKELPAGISHKPLRPESCRHCQFGMNCA